MITMDIKGLDGPERQLAALGEKADTKVLHDAGREALKVVEKDMRRHAGFDGASSAEYIRNSIKVRASTRKSRGNTMVTPRIGSSKKHCMKALVQEFGMVKQVAGPFIRPALDYNVQKVLRILTIEIHNGIRDRQ